MYMVIYSCILIALVSCAPPQQNQETEIIAVVEDNLTVPILIDCEEDFLGPEVISPHEVIVDTGPPHTFKWEISCIPDNYWIHVSEVGPNYGSLIYEGFTNNDPNPEYTSNVQVNAATTYSWTVSAISSKGSKRKSNEGVFTTGPICSVQELVAPTLALPSDGSINTGTPSWGIREEIRTTLMYPMDVCTPEYFESDFSVNADFSGYDSWNLDGPSNAGSTLGDDWKSFQDFTNALDDCTLYYWRARAVVEPDFSPWSDTFTFYTNFYDSCFFVSEFKGLKNANCRRDPWAGENYVGVIWEGDTAELLGLNDDASWGMFKLKNELECWVNMDLLEPDPPDAVFFPGYYPVLEHGEPPEDIPAPSPVDEPSSGETSDGETSSGCIVIDESGNPVCKIPCPQRSSSARACP